MRVRKRISSLTKHTTSVRKTNIVVGVLSRDDIMSVNKSITPKIRQNEQERRASMAAAAGCKVGGRQ